MKQEKDIPLRSRQFASERDLFIPGRSIPLKKRSVQRGEGQLGHLRQAAPTTHGVFVSFGEAEVSNFDALVSPLLRPRNASSRVTSGIRL